MSTWTSKALFLSACLGLAGCQELDFSSLGLGGSLFSREAPAAVQVSRGEVTVSGPPGYCVEPQQLRDTDAGSFVLLGSCAAISNDGAQPRPDTLALLTVSVGPGASKAISPADAETVQTYVTTAAGRAQLSRSGRPETVEILETRTFGPALFVHARDLGQPSRLLADDYWRALFTVKGRIISISVNGFRAIPLDSDEGLETLYAFTNRLWLENGVQPGSL